MFIDPIFLLDRIDYDGPWKALIELFFEDFILFFLPELHPLIDFTKKVTFLKQDLPKIVSDGAKKGDVVKDNIVEVQLKNGKKRLLLIHIETEAGHESNFSERMFVYFYRSKDKYPHDLTALAIFLGQQLPTNRGCYTYKFGQTEVIYKYPSYAVKEQSAAQLQLSDNAFSLAILACKYVLESRKEKTKKQKFQKRLDLKVGIVNFLQAHCKGRNYSAEQVQGLVSFVLNILLLPKKYENTFQTTILQPYEKSPSMKPTQVDIQFANGLMKAIYGETGESLYNKIQQANKELAKQRKLALREAKLRKQQEALRLSAIQKAEEERKQKELANLKAEEERKQKELANQKAEEERKQKELANQKAEEERKQKEEERKNTIHKLSKELKLTTTQIATFMNLPLQEIERILKG